MKRLLSIFLLLVLAGSALAGVPLHFGENQCSMGGMMDMDCCKAALLQTKTLGATDAKLLCALDCAQSGTTSLPNGVRVTPPVLALMLSHPAITHSLRGLPQMLAPGDRLHGPPGSPPTYLRNLALLI